MKKRDAGFEVIVQKSEEQRRFIEDFLKAAVNAGLKVHIMQAEQGTLKGESFVGAGLRFTCMEDNTLINEEAAVQLHEEAQNFIESIDEALADAALADSNMEVR